MAKGKRKKKKSSQTDCENSTAAEESHGTKIHRERIPDTTECSCLTQPQRRKRFLPCFAKKPTPPNCSIHSSNDSTVVKKPQSEGKEKDTTNQQCIVRRIGRWIVKKLTKGKKEEQIPTETLESESDAVCINTGEPPRLQILCQQVLSANVPEAYAQASITTDNSVKPRNSDKSVADNVSPETIRNIVISLKELCIRVAHNADSTSMDINDSNQDLDIDDEQPTDNDLELDNDEYNQVTVMSLKDMCKQALTYPDDLEYNFDDFKTDNTDEQDNHDTNDPELDSASKSSECHGNVLMTLIQLCTKVVVNNAEYKTTMDIDDIDKANNECYTPNGNLECDANKSMSLKDLCTTVAAASNAKIPGITDSENTGSKTTDISDKTQKLANDEMQSKEPTEQTSELTNKATEAESDQITVLPLKEMCKAALIYPDNLEYNFNDFKTDYTDEQDNHDTNDPELDRASISSECHGNVLMTLIQLCTRVVVSNDNDKETMDIDDKDKASNECYTRNENLECDANKLMSLKDPCTTVVAAANVETPGITDSENAGSKTTDNTDNKQKVANDETQSKEPTEKTPKLTNKFTKPELDQVTVLSLKDMCKQALTYPNALAYKFDDFKTDNTDEQDNYDTDDPELDSASISSECHGNVLMTLIQLCTKVVVNNAECKTTMDIDDIDKANNECYTPNGNLECDANKSMSLKDLCTTVVAAANTETSDITDGENASSKTTDNTDNKQKVANDETQSKEPTEKTPKLTNKATKPELDQVTVLSLKDICKQALTYPDDLAYNFDDFKTDHTDEQDNHDTNDPELDSASISSKCHGNVLMTLVQLCTKVVVSNIDDKETMDMGDIDKANNECYTLNGNLECDANKLMSLKDLCTTVVAAANTKTPGITDSENAGSKTTGNTDYRQKVANEETQSKEPTEKTPKLINKVTKPEFDQITVLSLKEMCIAAVAYLGDLKDQTDATRAELIDNHDKNVRNDPELDNTSKDLELDGSLQMSLSQLCTKVVNNNNDKKTTDRENKDNINDDEKQTKNVNLECDRKLMSLKDICTEASIKPSSVDVFNTKKSPTDNAIQCNNTRLFSLTDLCSAALRNKQSLKSDAGGSKTARQMHDKEFRISNDNRDTILENRLRYEKNPTRTLKELCSTAITNADMKTILKDIEKDYRSVEIANDMAENRETAQESVKHKSTSLRHERLAKGKNHEDNNTTVSEVNLATDTKQESKDSENDKRDNKSQTDKMSVQSQVRMCLEEVKKAGKFYEYFRQRQGFKAGIKPWDDKSKAKFLKKHHKVSTNDAVDQKIGISYTKSDQDSDRQFTLEEDLSEIMIKITKAIAMTLKELTKIDKGSINEFNTGYGYIDDVMPVYDKTKLKSLTRNRPINEIILENDKAIAMTLKELSAAADDNADSLRTRTCETKQVQVSKTDKLNKVESNTFDLLSGYDPNSPMSLKELYLKAMRKTYDLKVDINNIEGDQAANKDREGAEEIRSSLNKYSDMTDYLQKHYILTSALLSLMEMCDKESIQNKDEDIDQYMAKESDTKKECVKELLHLAEILNKLSEATTKNIDGTNKNQEQANTNIRHYCKEIKKVNDAMGEKRATDSSKNTGDVNGKSQFRKTKGTHLGNDNSHGQTTVQATVLDIDETGQKNDDEYDHQNHADGTDIDKIYKVTQAHYDDIGVNQINDIVKKESIDAKHVYVNSLQDTEKTNAGEMTKQNIEIKPTDKTQTQDHAAKKVNDRERDTGQNIIMAKINMTTGAAKAMADGTGIRPKDGETGRFETKKASEDERHDQLIIETYNDRKIKKKSRNKIKLQFEIDYHIGMDGKIIAAKLPENLHTLTGNEYTLPMVGEETIKTKKKKKIHSHYAGKAGKDSKRDNGARQSSHNQPEVKIEAKLKPISRCSGNEIMTFAALYCDDVVYISQATKNPAATQLPSEVTERVQRQRGTEERHAGTKKQARIGSLNDQSKEADLASECYAEKNSGYGEDQRQEVEQSSEFLAGQTSDSTAPGSSTAATSQRWLRKKKQKRKKAKWY